MSTCAHFLLGWQSERRDAGTTGAAGAVAPVAFFIRNVMGAPRVHCGCTAGALRVHIAQRDKNIINMLTCKPLQINY